MDEIDQKLSSNNVFLQSQAFYSLSEEIKKNAKDVDSVFESMEMKKLLKIINEGDICTSTMAVETIFDLVYNGLLPALASMQNFIAGSTSAKSPSTIARGITHLFIFLCKVETQEEIELCCPFTGPPKGPSNPYVLLITRRPEITKAVLEEINFLLLHPDTKVQKGWLALVKPLLYHCFCFTEMTPEITTPLIEQLVSYHKLLGNSLTQMLSKLAIYTRINSKNFIERKLLIFSGLSTIALENNDFRLLAALLPCLIISLPYAIKHGLPTRNIESKIAQIALLHQQGCDVTICALAEVLPLTAGELQVSLLKMGTTLLLRKDGNPIVAGRLLPSLLQILSVTSTSASTLLRAASALVSLIQSTPARISTNVHVSGNEFWDTLSLSFPDLATFIPAIELCNKIIKDSQYASDWLTNLTSSVHIISKFHYSIVTAVFLYQGSTSKTVEDAAHVRSKFSLLF